MNQAENKGKIKSFMDLIAWKEAHQLVLIIYDVTKGFPKEEIFGLVMQLRRAVVSITSNIAEGFSRQSYKDKIHFYSMALGSLTEVQNQILVSKDIKYLAIEEFNKLVDRTVIVSKLLNGLIKSSKTLILNS
ncbi:MAG: four helix bundle protein [Candidatus Doudnabacteria bacterium]|nr:four helix bundle protein [Candidatus Doudnabacteria bacterium]